MRLKHRQQPATRQSALRMTYLQIRGLSNGFPFSYCLSVLGHQGSHSCTYRVASVYMPREGDLQTGPHLFTMKDVTNQGSSWISINSRHRFGTACSLFQCGLLVIFNPRVRLGGMFASCKCTIFMWLTKFLMVHYAGNTDLCLLVLLVWAFT